MWMVSRYWQRRLQTAVIAAVAFLRPNDTETLKLVDRSAACVCMCPSCPGLHPLLHPSTHASVYEYTQFYPKLALCVARAFWPLLLLSCCRYCFCWDSCLPLMGFAVVSRCWVYVLFLTACCWLGYHYFALLCYCHFVAYFMLYVTWLLLFFAVVVKYLCRIPHSMRDSQIFHALLQYFLPHLTSRPRKPLAPQTPSTHFRLPCYTLLFFNFLFFFGLSTQSRGVSLVALRMMKAALMACVVAGAGGFTCREQKFTSTARLLLSLILLLLLSLLFTSSPSPSSLSLPMSFLLLSFIFCDFYFSRYSDSRKYLAAFTLVRIQTHNNSNNIVVASPLWRLNKQMDMCKNAGAQNSKAKISWKRRAQKKTTKKLKQKCRSLALEAHTEIKPKQIAPGMTATQWSIKGTCIHTQYLYACYVTYVCMYVRLV